MSKGFKVTVAVIAALQLGITTYVAYRAYARAEIANQKACLAIGALGSGLPFETCVALNK